MQMVICTKDFGTEEKLKAKDATLMELLVDRNMLVAGLLISNMVKELKNGLMAQSLLEVFYKDKSTEKEILLGLMEVAIQEISTEIKYMEWDNTFGAIRENMKVNG
jgi:hypothetical protein